MRSCFIILAGLLAGLAAIAQTLSGTLIVDYPAAGSVFPPGFAPPTFLWRDASPATRWQIAVSFAGSEPALETAAPGEPMSIGEIDPRCIGPTNELPRLTPEQKQTRTWRPDRKLWSQMQDRSVERTATVTITGYRGPQPVSSGSVTFRTSSDPVGAPIFFRDVPLMPSELRKGEIKPLSPKLMPLVRWSLRHLNEDRSRVMLEGIHSCANCHSFSADGKTLAMDLDGPHNDKGLYAIVPVAQRTSIANENVISWRPFRGQMKRNERIGFMSQISPDGRFVVTTTQVRYFVANYKDYRFLQTFYPTQGVLAWYSRADGQVRTLPGADDPRYVQSNGVWSPDDAYLVFSRAEASEPYPDGKITAEFANDPREPQIRYDLYRIPFNGGKGGRAVPVAGASGNGMSNSFPKISPDGKWIVYVRSRNGQLMRPDGELFIVPAAGGEARRMKCNTPLMNSWHSFSPNGRWMVFSSKSRGPYTKMFLTHIDEDGNDTPAILIENATAANRAVNIPEFVNVPEDGWLTLDAPAAEFFRLYDEAWELTGAGQVEAALAAWLKALKLDPGDSRARTNFAALLMSQGKIDEALSRLVEVVRSSPDFADGRVNLGIALLHKGRVNEAVAQFARALEIDGESAAAYANLGTALIQQGRFADARDSWREALRLEPDRVPVMSNLAWLLAACPDPRTRNGAEAVQLARRAVQLAGDSHLQLLDILAAALAEAGEFEEAVKTARRAIALAAPANDRSLEQELRARLALYEARKPYHDSR